MPQITPTDQIRIRDSLNILASTPSVPLDPSTDEEVTALIKHLKPRKAPGLDGISNLQLRHFTPPAIYFLTNVFNACLTLSYFPAQWKISKVITIPKPNKDHTDPKNHRPIHLLSAPSKLLERIILSRLNSTLPPNTFPPEQMGFRKHHSTTDQIVRVTTLTSVNKAKGKDSLVVCLDIEQAFDSVWHEGLLIKLTQLTSNPPLVNLIRSFLNQRKFTVHCRQTSSSLRPTTAGVPQGSVLSPTLFNIYTSDIPSPPSSPKIHLAIYADDVAVIAPHLHPANATALNHYLSTLHNYYAQWKLKIHPHKSTAIHITTRRNQHSPPLYIDGTQIQYSPHVKYLGVEFDKKLSFNKNLTQYKNKASCALRAILPLLRSRSLLTRCKLHLVKACIWPILTYAAPAWGNISRNSSAFHKVSQTHKRTLHKAMGAQWFVSYKTILKDLNQPTLEDIIQDRTTNYFLNASTHENPLIRYAASKEQHHNDPLLHRISTLLKNRHKHLQRSR